jgi:hypothetical protein
MKPGPHTPKVGVPDPELKTSPIFDETDDEFLSLDLEIESGGCDFNNQRYPLHSYVHSGNELLYCDGRGVWVRKPVEP